MNNKRRPLEMFHWLTAAALALLMAQGAPAAAPTPGAGGAGGGTTQINLSVPLPAMTGGEWRNAKVILSNPAPSGGAAVTLTSDTESVTIGLLTPASLSVPAGSTSVSFKVITKPVSDTEIATIEATYGSATATVKLTLQPTGVSSVSLSPASVDWGGSATGRVLLESPAPQDVDYYKNVASEGKPPVYMPRVRKGGAEIALSGGGVTVPETVSVPPGQSYAQFTATAPQKSSCSMGNGNPLTSAITASWLNSKSANLTVGQNNGKPSRYTSKTIRIEPSTLVGVSHDGLVLVLEHSECADLLKAGDVMFLEDLGVLDVGKVATFPSSKLFPQGGIAIGVSSASLTDFINDGNVKVEIKSSPYASEPGGGGSNDPFNAAAEPNSEQPPSDTWKYKGNATPTSYSFTAFKNNKGLLGTVNAKGEIEKDEGDFLAVIHGDKVQEAEFTADMGGSVDVDWIAQVTSGNDIGDPRLRMRPLLSALENDEADEIPFLFQIDANLIFKPGFGEKAAAKGHFKVDFEGEGGINGAYPVVKETLKATPEISSTTSSAKAPHGAVVAVNVPRFALLFSDTSFMWAVWARQPAAMSMKASDFADSFEGKLDEHLPHDVEYPDPKDYFNLKRGAYVQWAYSVSYAGAGLLAMLPCQQYYQNYLVQAGIDKDMLGSISGSIPPKKGVEVYKKTGVTAIPSIKGCYPKK